MGKINSLITFTGKVDNVVGAKGKNGDIIIRKYQKNPTKSQTTNQVKQRTRFLTATGMAHNFPETAYAGLTKYAKSLGLTLQNAFTKVNLTKTFNYQGAPKPVIYAESMGDNEVVGRVEWPEIEISRGGEGNVTIGTPQFNDPETVTIEWQKRADDITISAADTITFVVFCAELEKDPPVVVTSKAALSVQRVNIVVPNTWTGQSVKVWAFETFFNTEADSVEYLSIFNSDTLQASARRRELLSSAEYTRTFWVGSGSIS